MRKIFTPFFALVLSLAAMAAAAETPKIETAIFAGGCFWCMHAEFEQTAGVRRVLSGYTGGVVENPTYEEVGTGDTGHVEAVEVVFDPAQVSYEKLLDIFWSNIDPTDAEGQFCDKGTQYAAGIFYLSEAQKTAAEASIAAVEKKLSAKIVTFLRPAATFYPAEDYHQSYYKKSETRYKMYKMGCGREGKLEKIWGKEPNK